jgi:hypothetical protein
MLLALCCSFASAILFNATESAHFPDISVSANESVQAWFNSSLLHAVFLWTPPDPTSSVAVNLVLTARNGTAYASSQTADFGIRVSGASCVLIFDVAVTLEAWFVPESSCPGPAIAYSAPALFTDILRPAVSYDSLCIFFPHSPALRLAFDGTQSRTALASVSKSGLTTPVCEPGRRCNSQYRMPSYLITQKILPSRLSLGASLSGRPEWPCARAFLPLVAEGRTQIGEMELASADMFSCFGGEVAGGYSLVLAVVGALFFLLICATMMSLAGGWAWIAGRVRGVRERLLNPSLDQFADLDDVPSEKEDEAFKK